MSHLYTKKVTGMITLIYESIRTSITYVKRHTGFVYLKLPFKV